MTPNLQNLFDSKHAPTDEQIHRLKRADSQLLSRIVRGREKGPSRKAAMTILSRLNPRLARRTLAEILLEPDTPRDVRISAAVDLGRLGGRAAEERLLNALQTERDPVFVMKIVAALGKVGTSKSVHQLRRLTRSRRTPALQRQAKFSLCLIGFRGGSSRFKPPEPAERRFLAPRDGRKMRKFPVRSALPERVQAVTKLILGDEYGLELSPEVGFSLRCFRSRLTLLLNQGVVRTDPATSLLSASSIAGLVAEEMTVDRSQTVRYILLSWPKTRSGGDAELRLYRTDGIQVAAGALSSESGGFSLTSVVDGANSALLVTGRAVARELRFDEFQSEDFVAGYSIPRPAKINA